MMDNQGFVFPLYVAAIVILVLGALTLIPSPGASKACLIGYKAKCSFAPISTGLMFVLSGVILYIRMQIIK